QLQDASLVLSGVHGLAEDGVEFVKGVDIGLALGVIVKVHCDWPSKQILAVEGRDPKVCRALARNDVGSIVGLFRHGDSLVSSGAMLGLQPKGSAERDFTYPREDFATTSTGNENLATPSDRFGLPNPQSARAMQDGVRLALLHFLQQLPDFKCW